MKKLALFDVDGTMYDGYIIFPLADYQLKHNLIEKDCTDRLKNDFEMYKKGEVNYENTTVNLLNHWAKGLKGRHYDQVKQNVISFFNNNCNNFYDYTVPVINALKTDYDIYFITAEPQFVGEVVATLFSVSGHMSSQLEVKGGIFSGEVDKYLVKGHEKEAAIKSSMFSYDEDDSIAFGDSETDIEMLSFVENAICINPSEKLKSVAIEKNWNIISPENVEDLVKKLT